MNLSREAFEAQQRADYAAGKRLPQDDGPRSTRVGPNLRQLPGGGRVSFYDGGRVSSVDTKTDRFKAVQPQVTNSLLTPGGGRVTSVGGGSGNYAADPKTNRYVAPMGTSLSGARKGIQDTIYGAGVIPKGAPIDYNAGASPFRRPDPAKLPSDGPNPGIPSHPLADKYGWKGKSTQPAGSTLMEDQMILREWRANNPAKFFSGKGVSIDGEPDFEESYVPPGKRKKVVGDPWEGMRNPREANAAKTAPKPMGLSLFGGGIPGLLMSMLSGGGGLPKFGGPQVQGAAMPVSTSGPANYTPQGMLHPGTGWTDSATGNDAAYMPQSWQDNPRNYNGGY
jgi:hypothetical protein